MWSEMLTLVFDATTVCVEQVSVGLRAYRDAVRHQSIERHVRNVLTKFEHTVCDHAGAEYGLTASGTPGGFGRHKMTFRVLCTRNKARSHSQMTALQTTIGPDFNVGLLTDLARLRSLQK